MKGQNYIQIQIKPVKVTKAERICPSGYGLKAKPQQRGSVSTPKHRQLRRNGRIFMLPKDPR